MRYLVLFSLFVLAACGHNCQNFTIKSVHIVPAKLIGEDSLANNKSSYVLVNFDLEFVNCKSNLLGGVPEPGNKGINDSITSISILDSNQIDITDKFVGARFKGYVIREVTDSNNQNSLYTNVNLQELKKDINLRRKNERGLGLEFQRPFSVPEDIKWPLFFKMKFNDSETLVQRINYNIKDIKTYIIE